MTQLPLISVIVPVYKVEKYLDQCIRSIVGQTYPNLEIILVDDGSPDASGAMCDAWAEKDSRIRVIHQENAGAGAARNAGLDASKGELLGFVDSDDYLAPQMYTHLCSLIKGDTDIAECEIVETEEKNCLLEDGSNAEISCFTAEEAMMLHIADRWFRQTPPNKLYRREVLDGVRFPVGRLIDDEFFTYLAIGKARSLIHSTARMYAYRQQPGSAMHKPYSLKRLDGIQAKRLRLAFLEEQMPELVSLAKSDLAMSCVYGMQGTLRSLTGEERNRAETILKDTWLALKPLPVRAESSAKRRALLRCAEVSLPGTARALNVLEDCHILK